MRLQELIENNLNEGEQLDEVVQLLPLIGAAATRLAPTVARIALSSIGGAGAVSSIGGAGNDTDNERAPRIPNTAQSTTSVKSQIPDYVTTESDGESIYRKDKEDDMLVELTYTVEKILNNYLKEKVLEGDLDINDDDSPKEILRKIKEMLKDPEKFHNFMIAITELLGH